MTTRVFVIAEGETEETFVNDLLAPNLRKRQIYATPLLLGGVSTYGKIDHMVTKKLKDDQSAYVTTMLDLYALPSELPGKKASEILKSGADKARHIAEAWKATYASHKTKSLLLR